MLTIKPRIEIINGLFTLALAGIISAILITLAPITLSSDNLLISMYLDRWTHFEPIYAYGNLIITLFFLSGIYLTGKHSRLYIPTLLAITILFPVFYTILTVLVFGDLSSKGFSGIASAYFGFLVWMTFISMLNKTQTDPSAYMKTVWFLAAIATITIASLPLEPAITSIGGGAYVIKNIWAHYLGYAFGLIVPTALCLIRKEKFESCIDETGVYGLIFITVKIILTL